MNIREIKARMILDSRGNPTVEADVWCENGGFGRAAVPSGASTGVHEAHELRDGGKEFSGKGVNKAINNVNGVINDALKGVPCDDQYRVDKILIELDATENKSNLGANAILSASLAVAHAAANVRKTPLYKHINDISHNPDMSIPLPMFNVLNGGSHATNSSDFQEYMLMPIRANKYKEAVQIAAEIFASLKKVLSGKGFATTVGDEGGFAPSVSSNTEMLDLLVIATKEAGYSVGEDIAFAMDVAASEFYRNGKYVLATEEREIGATEMIDYLEDMSKKYPIMSIEDGLFEDDWEGWVEQTKRLSKLQLVGDDLLVTNQKRLEKAINEKAGNAILIKPNQIGTLTETIKTIAAAKEAGWNTVVSHRSGETEDVTIAHIAVGTGAGQIKTGSVSRSERNSKHNELMRIEDTNGELKLKTPF